MREQAAGSADYPDFDRSRKVRRNIGVIRGYKISPITLGRPQEHKPTEEETTAYLNEWYAEFLADRMRRGIPPKGLPCPNGVLGLLRERQLVR